MSLRLLQLSEGDPKDHRVSDDIESFMHVLFWVAARYAPNGMTPEERGSFLRQFDYNETDRVAQKRRFIQNIHGVREVKAQSSAFTFVLDELLQTLHSFYRYNDHFMERMEKMHLEGLRLGATAAFEGVMAVLEQDAGARRQGMDSHDWMLNKLAALLQDDVWKNTNDKAVHHNVGQPFSVRPKRRRTNSGADVMKRQRVNRNWEDPDATKDQIGDRDREGLILGEETEARDEYLDEPGNEDYHSVG